MSDLDTREVKPTDLKTHVTDLPDPDLTANAETVLARRYLKVDRDGDPTERPKDMFWRVAQEIARQDANYGASREEVLETAKRFYRMMANGVFMPNSPTLMNAGRPLGQLSACFVLPVKDTMTNGEDGIYDTLKNMALIHQSGGGTGFSFSNLRPSGSVVRSTKGVASGPVSFMRLYDASTDVVKQGGFRRGANMGILRVDHPDIMEFIDCKTEAGEIENFNISVAVTEEFMQKARAEEEYDLIDPRDGSVVGQLNAADVLDRIIENAHANGEPGLFFIDRANAANPIPHMGEIEATNPCGEIPLPPYGVCNLGHVNLAKFVRNGRIDKTGLESAVIEGVHFLDNVIDANNYPLEKIRERSDQTRRIGLGVMGLADALIELDIPYDSEEAIEFSEEVAEFVYESAVVGSEMLAVTRGVFPAFEDSEYESPRRNAYVNTVAPTGTTSIIAGCSSGIEPLFAVAFQRNQAGTTMTEVHPGVEEEYDVDSKSPSRIREMVEDDPVFVTAHEIAPEWHIRHQAAWQDHTQQAISKTINFSKKASVDDIREAYMLADELGCKGITVYRDGSREGQALSTDADAGTESASTNEPDVLTGETSRIDTPLGKLYLTINEHEGEPYETFFNIGKAGGSVRANAEAIARLTSLALQHGVDLADVYEQLRGISSERAIGFGPNKVLSMPDGAAQLIGEYMGRDVNGDGTEDVLNPCPECGVEMSRQEGCLTCRSCGHSKCG